MLGGEIVKWILVMLGLPGVGVMVPAEAVTVVSVVGEAEVVAFMELGGRVIVAVMVVFDVGAAEVVAFSEA